MNQKWESRKEVTPENLLKEIKEMASTIGIVIFGADGEFKNEVVEKVTRELGCAVCYHELPSTDVLGEAMDALSTVIVVLNSVESADRSLRQEVVQAMKSARAQMVVGIYTKNAPSPEGSLIPYSKIAEFRAAAADIERSKPKTSEFDYFILP